MLVNGISKSILRLIRDRTTSYVQQLRNLFKGTLQYIFSEKANFMRKVHINLESFVNSSIVPKDGVNKR